MSTITLRLSLILLLCVAFTDSEAQRGPQVTAMPEQPEATELALFTDPLEASTAHCDFDAPRKDYVKIDETQVAKVRKLKRFDYPDTPILALKQTSQHWLTTCPVVLQGIPDGTKACRPENVLNDGTLRIVKAGNSIRFKIEGTTVGTVRGNLTPVANPHGDPENVWLRSNNVAHSDGSSPHDYYVYLQDIGGYKYYLVEVFNGNDPNCLARHLPSNKTLCRNDGRQSHCDLGKLSSASSSRTSVAQSARSSGKQSSLRDAGTPAVQIKPPQRGLKLLPSAAKAPGPPPYVPPQTDTGGGHEPPVR